MPPHRSIAAAACAAALLAPVTTAQITVGLPPVADATLYEDPTGSLANGAGSRFFAGIRGGGGELRGLVRFDVAATIPSCARIRSARLILTVVQTNGNPTTVALRRTLASWTEGTTVASGSQSGGGPATPGSATWIHRSSPTPLWANAGGDFAATDSASLTVADFGTYTWTTPQMAADVQGWVTTPSTDAGWLLLGGRNPKAFATREDANSTIHPILEVTYDVASVTSIGTGCNGSGASPYTAATNGLPTFPNPGFAVTVSGGPTTIAEVAVIGVRRLVPPVPCGGPGCVLHVDTSAPFILAPGGGGTVSLPIPHLPNGTCVVLPVQVVGLDVATNLMVLSNALDLRFGPP